MQGSQGIFHPPLPGSLSSANSFPSVTAAPLARWSPWCRAGGREGHCPSPVASAVGVVMLLTPCRMSLLSQNPIMFFKRRSHLYS